MLGEAGGKIYVAVRGWREKIGCPARLEGKDKVPMRGWTEKVNDRLLGEAGGKI